MNTIDRSVLNFKSKARILLTSKAITTWLVILLIILIGGIVLGVRYCEREQYKQRLAVQAEKVVARQFANTFTGVTKITFTKAETSDDGSGWWTLDYKFDAKWKFQLDKANRSRVRYAPINNLVESNNGMKKYKLMDDFNYGSGNSSTIYDSHRGKTVNSVVVTYTDGKKEIFNGQS